MKFTLFNAVAVLLALILLSFCAWAAVSFGDVVGSRVIIGTMLAVMVPAAYAAVSALDADERLATNGRRVEESFDRIRKIEDVLGFSGWGNRNHEKNDLVRLQREVAELRRRIDALDPAGV